MDGQAGRGGERTLRRIAAMLVAFALLAERSAARSLPVRFLVLLILRRAEGFAADFALEATGQLLPSDDAFVPAGYDPEDAHRLAARFRALAALLAALLPATCPRRRARPGVVFADAGLIADLLRGPMIRANDTS